MFYDERNGHNDEYPGSEYPEQQGRSDSSGQDKEMQSPDWVEELDSAMEGPKPKKRMSRLKKALLTITGLLILALTGAGAYAYTIYTDVREPQRILLDEVSFEKDYDVTEAFPEHTVNMALLGFDRGWDREWRHGEHLFRPDMLAVFSINFETEEVSVVRIPRDSYVPIYGMGGMHDKINHSFFYGYYYGSSDDRDDDGIEFTLNTVSKALGDIPLHYYVSVDMYSVIALVDAVGGIYFEVEETLYDQHWNVGEVLVPEGPQVMDGETYLRYLQYRDPETGQDEGRMDRQMELMQETFLYLREEGKITDLPATYRIYKDYVETDLTYSQIASLAYFGRDLDIENESIHFYTLPGSNQSKDGIYYQVLDQEERVRIIKEAFGVEVDPWPSIVLEDSPEYIEEQERKRKEEEREKGRDEEEINADENEEPEETEEDDDRGGNEENNRD